MSLWELMTHMCHWLVKGWGVLRHRSTGESKSLIVPFFLCYRYFLVHASKQGRQEVIRDFFERMSDSLQDRKEWKDWFGRFQYLLMISTVVGCWTCLTGLVGSSTCS